MIGHRVPLTAFVLIALNKLEYLVIDKVGGRQGMICHPVPLTVFVLIALKKLEYLVIDKVGGR